MNNNNCINYYRNEFIIRKLFITKYTMTIILLLSMGTNRYTIAQNSQDIFKSKDKLNVFLKEIVI